MSPEAVRALAHEMGVTEERLNHVLQAASYDEATQRLIDLKALVKKGFRQLALKYHPDRNPGDAGAEAKFKALTPIWQEFEKLRIQPKPQPIRMPQLQRIVIREVTTPFGGRVTTFGSVVSSLHNTRSATYDATQVAFIRIV